MTSKPQSYNLCKIRGQSDAHFHLEAENAEECSLSPRVCVLLTSA